MDHATWIRTEAKGGIVAKHIGIAAVSPEGAALCYRQIFRHASELLERHDHPTVSIYNHPFADYADAVRADDWRTVGRLLRHSAERVAAMGAELVITPDNAVQHAVPLAEVGSPIPWLSMTDCVAAAVHNDGLETVGVIGTLTVIGGSAYQTYLGMRGIKIVRPERQRAVEIDRMIFDELASGIVRPTGREMLVDTIRKMDAEGCQGVILACSEAGLVIGEENSPLPVYDSTDLLARCALRHSIEGIGTTGRYA